MLRFYRKGHAHGGRPPHMNHVHVFAAGSCRTLFPDSFQTSGMHTNAAKRQNRHIHVTLAFLCAGHTNKPPPSGGRPPVTSQNNVAQLTAHITPLALKKTECVWLFFLKVCVSCESVSQINVRGEWKVNDLKLFSTIIFRSWVTSHNKVSKKTQKNPPQKKQGWEVKVAAVCVNGRF